jgi:CHAT domain-containing protein
MRSGSIHKYTVAAAPGTVLDALADLRRRLENRATREYLIPARELYRWLVLPLKKELDDAAISELVIVPDDRFAAVPFAALHDGHDFLLRDYAVSVAPGLSLTDPRPVRLRDASLLAGGLDLPLNNYRRLLHVGEEIHALADQFPGQIVFNDEFRTERIKTRLSNEEYAIIHLATHGVFASRASDSFLVTYDGSLTVRDLEQSLAGSRFREVPIEMLALSACETATGDVREAFGMAGLAVKAGARSALASLWVVNDEASAALMPMFYRNLYEHGLARAQALRAAQLEMMKSEQFWHPAYWAAYILIGNWQ